MDLEILVEFEVLLKGSLTNKTVMDLSLMVQCQVSSCDISHDFTASLVQDVIFGSTSAKLKCMACCRDIVCDLS